MQVTQLAYPNLIVSFSTSDLLRPLFVQDKGCTVLDLGQLKIDLRQTVHRAFHNYMTRIPHFL